jgi:hypothetical protein
LAYTSDDYAAWNSTRALRPTQQLPTKFFLVFPSGKIAAGQAFFRYRQEVLLGRKTSLKYYTELRQWELSGLDNSTVL